MDRKAHTTEHHISVRRTARFVTMGTPGEGIREVWFACHGYGELASTFIRGLVRLLDAESRLIVAPEALGRFYLDPSHEKIGASWMTREDRLNGIRDYLNYLDAVHGEILSWITRLDVPFEELTFDGGHRLDDATLVEIAARHR